MATRPYVPRADGESSIGVAAKKWGNIFAYKIDEATSLGNNAGLGYRQPSTAQSIGDIKYHATLPANWYLECTTAGTTGSGTLTITTPTVGGTVSDGTVTWTIRKNASTQDLTGYLPLSGGAMTSIHGMRRNTDDSWMEIDGGTVYTNGAHIALYGKDINNGSDIPGAFRLVATNGVNSRELNGKPNGTLTWNDNSLDKSAVVAESLGTNGYRKYASGLIEQWGYAPAGQGEQTQSFPISFSTKCRVIGTPHVTSLLATCGIIDDSYLDKFLYRCETISNNQGIVMNWYAIGY